MTWRPIETAPKDGTQILILLSGGDIIVGPAPIEMTKQERIRFARQGEWPDYKRFSATHWQPLPPPPKETDR